MRRPTLPLALGLALAACSTPVLQPKTADELRGALDKYEQGDASVTEGQVTALFARLDAEVATARAKELETPADRRADLTAERETLEGERRELQARWMKARIARLGDDAGKALKGLGEEIGKSVEEAGRRMRESMQQHPPPTTPDAE